MQGFYMEHYFILWSNRSLMKVKDNEKMESEWREEYVSRHFRDEKFPTSEDPD